MNERAGLMGVIGTLARRLAGPAPDLTEDEVEALLRDIDRAAATAGPDERDAALRALGEALHDDDLDEVSEALLIAACRGPLAGGGDPAPVAEAIVSFACVTLPVCCSYFLIMVSAAGDDEAAAGATGALAPLLRRFPRAGFEITALHWTAGTLETLTGRSSVVAAELRDSIFVGPALYALAPSLPEARALLRVLDPALAGAARPGAVPPSERPPRAGRATGPPARRGHGEGRPRPPRPRGDRGP